MNSIAWLIALLFSLVHLAGLLSAAHAILNSRTTSGAIAWSVSLVTFPYLALPLYWILSREKFYGYVQLLRSHSLSHNRYRDVEYFLRAMRTYRCQESDTTPIAGEDRRVLEQLTHLPFTTNNRVDLLIDGHETFEAHFRAFRQAERYILLLYYIVADDQIGQRFKEELLAASERGVKVYLLYDEFGSMASLGQPYIDELRRAGAEVHPFTTNKGRFNTFQVNFRNHRKIAVVDGRMALVGGVNVQDDSMGMNPFYGNWRDTHVYVEGPVVQNIQLVWAEDYYWSTASLPKLEWNPTPAQSQDREALYVPTGPLGTIPSGVLFFLHCINRAKERLWLASPYFTPDASFIEALLLASLRGVEIRIIIPERYDMLVMYLAAFSYFPEIEETDIRIFRYRTGHPHQKVMLIDDRMAWVGSSNVDNRSMRLNFEGNLVVRDPEFCREVEEMLQRDLERSVEVGPEDYYGRGLLFKLGVRIARLFTPIL